MTFHGSDLKEIQGSLNNIKSISVLFLVLGVSCAVFAAPTIVIGFTAPVPGVPIIAGLGVPAGVVTFVTGILGLRFLRKAIMPLPTSVRCSVITYQVFLFLSQITCWGYTIFSIWSFVLCSHGFENDRCGGINWPTNYLLASANSVMALSLQVMGVVVIWCFFKVVRRINDMTYGHPENVHTPGRAYNTGRASVASSYTYKWRQGRLSRLASQRSIDKEIFKSPRDDSQGFAIGQSFA